MDSVKKIPYSIGASQQAFDITTQQPQLFVTPDFATLSSVLEEFASGMAVRTGGIYGLDKARETNAPATATWSSGLQASGVVGDYIEHNGEPAYVRFTSATALAFNNTQLDGHGRGYHAHGFGSPVGKLRGEDEPLEKMTDGRINGFTDKEGVTTLEFDSGIKVQGQLNYIMHRNGMAVLLSFSGCKVTLGEKLLFHPDWGVYDMAVGEKIVSVFPGPADPTAWGLRYPVPKTKTHKIVHTEKEKRLHTIYTLVRSLRDADTDDHELREAWNILKQEYPGEWLLPLEILELIERQSHPVLYGEIREHLEAIKNRPGLAKLVEDGLSLLAPDFEL